MTDKFNKPRKLDYSILPTEGVALLYRAAKQGADKYGKRNWLAELDNPEIDERLDEAIHRHYIKSFYEKMDEDSGASHEEHIALNILIKLARIQHREVTHREFSEKRKVENMEDEGMKKSCPKCYIYEKYWRQCQAEDCPMIRKKAA